MKNNSLFVMSIDHWTHKRNKDGNIIFNRDNITLPIYLKKDDLLILLGDSKNEILTSKKYNVYYHFGSGSIILLQDEYVKPLTKK